MLIVVVAYARTAKRITESHNATPPPVVQTAIETPVPLSDDDYSVLRFFSNTDDRQRLSVNAVAAALEYPFPKARLHVLNLTTHKYIKSIFGATGREYWITHDGLLALDKLPPPVLAVKKIEELPEEVQSGPPGMLDIMVDLEHALPEFGVTMGKISTLMDEMRNLAVQFTPRPGDNFSRRLELASGLAAQLLISAPSFESYASELDGLIARLDVGMQLFRNVVKSQTPPSAEALSTSENIRTTASKAGDARRMFDTLATTLDTSSQLSKSLRNPTARVASAIRRMSVTTKIAEDWGLGLPS